MQRSKPTIKDVAKAAGVSPTTVSHALNGKGNVSKETIERVMEVARKTGYRPSPMAQGLQQSRLGLLGLIIRPLYTLETFLPEGVDYFLRFAGAASLAAMEHGYSMMLVGDPTRKDVPLSALAADAYIVTEPFENDPVLTFLSERRFPLVTVDADPARPLEFIVVDEDTQNHARTMLDHLREAGARRIALVTGTDRNEWNLSSQLAFQSWAADKQIIAPIFEVPEVEGELAGGKIIDHFFSAHPDEAPDAIFCLTGRHAAGVVTAALERGIRVPEDLLISAASATPTSRTMRPSVTSLELLPEQTARKAVEVAVQLAEHRTVDNSLKLPAPKLVVRETTMR